MKRDSKALSEVVDLECEVKAVVQRYADTLDDMSVKSYGTYAPEVEMRAYCVAQQLIHSLSAVEELRRILELRVNAKESA